MSVTILPSRSFLKVAKSLAKKYPSFVNDFHSFEEEIKKNPEAGTDLGGGFRKIRMAITSKGKGKSGGARVITFITSSQDNIVNLLYMYDKSERESIGTHELLALLRLNGLD